jgi:ribonuclease P protein component
MLPKVQRINTNRFNEIITSGKNINAGGFYFKVLPCEEMRFAVVVPKKICKNAVKRHFIKRRVFNAIKENKVLFPTADYLVFVNKEAFDFSYEKTVEDIKNMAQKLDYK